jgi:hypothetical protein
VERFTFVLKVHPKGISTIENVSTAERVEVPELGDVGEQIERWLAELSPAERRAPARSEQAAG